MARTIVFTDSYPYVAPTAASRTRRPVIPVRFFHVSDGDRSLDLTMLLDSGADMTCLPSDIAHALGIDLSALETRVMRGLGGAVPTYRHEGLLMALANMVMRCPVQFVPGLSAFLLGREAVFDEFMFGFEPRAGLVHVQSTSMASPKL